MLAKIKGPLVIGNIIFSGFVAFLISWILQGEELMTPLFLHQNSF